MDIFEDIPFKNSEGLILIVLDIPEVYTILLSRSPDPENLLKHLLTQATFNIYDRTPLNIRNPLGQYRPGLGNSLSKSAYRLGRSKSKRFYWMGNRLRSKHLK